MKAYLETNLPPSVNVYYRRGRFATYLSPAGRAYKSHVSEQVIEFNVPKFGSQRLKMKIIMRPRDKRKTDVDSRIKACLDSLESAGVFDDDYVVEHLEVTRGEPIKGGKLLVIIETIEEEL